MPFVEGGPKDLNSILERTYQQALSQGQDKSSASAIAWSTAKREYKKKGDKWVEKLYNDLTDLVQVIQKEALKTPSLYTYLSFALSKLAAFLVNSEQEITKEITSVDVQGLELVREDLGGKKKKKPLKLRDVTYSVTTKFTKAYDMNCEGSGCSIEYNPVAHGPKEPTEQHLPEAIHSPSREFEKDKFPKGSYQKSHVDGVEYLKVSEVLVNPYNREPDRNKVDKMKEDIDHSGRVIPLVYSEVDKDGHSAKMITDGHHRYLAIKELGYKEFPAVMSNENGTESSRGMSKYPLKKGGPGSGRHPGSPTGRTDDLDSQIAGHKEELKAGKIDMKTFTARVQPLYNLKQRTQHFTGETTTKVPMSHKEQVSKGGPGSGCSGPNCGRPSSGNKEYDEPFHSGTHVQQFLNNNNVIIASVDKDNLSEDKNATRQTEFEQYLQDKKIPYKKGRGFSQEWGGESSYIIHTPSKEESASIKNLITSKYKQDALISVRNGHATLESKDGKVQHSSTSNMQAGEQLTDNYTEVDGQRFKFSFK